MLWLGHLHKNFFGFPPRLSYFGIHSETVKALLKVGAKKIVIGGRSKKLQDEFLDTLKREQNGLYDTDTQVDGTHLIDLADLESVKAFALYVAGTYPVVDVLICNAGVMNIPAGLTKQGIEQQMGINCVGHFLLAKLLAKQTKRQVWVSSYGHTLKGGERINIEQLRQYSLNDFKEYDGFKAYQQSKLGNILLAKEFKKRYPNLEAVSLHPGTIYTPLYRETGIISAIKVSLSMIPAIMRGDIMQVLPKVPSAGASTTITCATLPSNVLVNGAYYSNCAVGYENHAAKNPDDACKLFDYCDEVTKEFQ
jgi:retinol dehydrogenase 14